MGVVALSAGGWDTEVPQNVDEFREFLKQLRDWTKIPPSVFALLDELEPHKEKALVSEARISAFFLLSTIENWVKRRMPY